MHTRPTSLASSAPFPRIGLAALAVVLAAAPVGLVGCATTHGQTPLLDEGESVTALVGPEGATLDVGGAQLVVPPGAIATPTTLTVTASSVAPPAAFSAYAPVLVFAPADLTLAVPVEVRIPFRGDPALATVFSRRDGSGPFRANETRVEGSYAYASLARLTETFVGTACSGEACCDQGNDQLDLLLVVDDSNSMAEEQELLRTQLAHVFEVLVSGDRDGDGVQDFPAATSVHVGVASTDLGTGTAVVASCTPDGGDEARLLAPASCGLTSPFLTLDATADDPSGDLASFVDAAQCAALLGTGGCGFEQQLDATLLALSPAAPTAATGPGYTPPTTREFLAPMGDGANAGFLRDGSILAIVELSDENDGSSPDTDLYSPASRTYDETALNLRTGLHPEALYPIARYVDGLLALRANPADLIFAGAVGLPLGVVSDSTSIDFDALLADPAMAQTVDAAGTNLVPVCESDHGLAFPGERFVATAQGLAAAGAGTALASICEPSFNRLLDGLIARLSARAAGSCGGT